MKATSTPKITVPLAPAWGGVRGRARSWSSSDALGSSSSAEPPTAYAVGIPAIAFVNHWLTPVVGFKRRHYRVCINWIPSRERTSPRRL